MSVVVTGQNSAVVVSPAQPSRVVVNPLGEPGPQGEPGLPGADGAGVGRVEFVQDAAVQQWLIPHSFDVEPLVQVFDSTDTLVYVEVVHSLHLVTVQMDLPLSGRALLLA